MDGKKPKSVKRINSRNKGKVIEREAVKLLTEMGFPCHRTAQNRGKTGDCADIEFEDEKFYCHIEVKGDKSIGVGTVALKKAWEQARDDAKAERLHKIPMVLWKEHKKGWRLTWNLYWPMEDKGETLATVGGTGAILMRLGDFR